MFTTEFTVQTPSIGELAERVRDEIFDSGGGWYAVDQVTVHDDWWEIDGGRYLIVIEGMATVTGAPARSTS